MPNCGELHAERAALADCEKRGRGPGGGDYVRDAGALCASRAAAALHRGDPRGGDLAGRDRLRRSEREGSRTGAGDLARRRGRGRARRRRGGDCGAVAEPAVPQARPHRPAAGDAEAGDVARRPHLNTPPATRPGSPASRAASWSTAGAPNPTRSRSASAPSSPTTPCSPPARPSGVCSSQPSCRRRLRPPSSSAPRLPAACAPSTSRRCSSSSPPEADASALRDAGAEVLVADGIRRPSRSRPPRHHQPLPRGRPDSGQGLPGRRPARRSKDLRRPHPSRRRPSGFSCGWREMRGGRERRRSPRPQAPPQSRRAPRANNPCPTPSKRSATMS